MLPVECESVGLGRLQVRGLENAAEDGRGDYPGRAEGDEPALGLEGRLVVDALERVDLAVGDLLGRAM